MRFAAEITLPRASSDLVFIHVIPDSSRPSAEQTIFWLEQLKLFFEAMQENGI